MPALSAGLPLTTSVISAPLFVGSPSMLGELRIERLEVTPRKA